MARQKEYDDHRDRVNAEKVKTMTAMYFEREHHLMGKQTSKTIKLSQDFKYNKEVPQHRRQQQEADQVMMPSSS